MEARLRRLLAQASSPSWHDRCEAAMGLAEYRTQEAVAALRGLLCDSADTAPIQSAAEALLKRGDSDGAELMFHAIATGDEDAADHLCYFILCGAKWDHAIWELARSSLNSRDPAVQRGAADLLEAVG